MYKGFENTPIVYNPGYSHLSGMVLSGIDLTSKSVICLLHGRVNGFFTKPEFKRFDTDLAGKILRDTLKTFDLFKIVSEQAFCNCKENEKKIFLNISPLDLKNPHFKIHINYLLMKYEIDPQKVTFVLTNEQRINEDGLEVLKFLTGLGFHISIDNFSLITNGNESLGNLKFLSNRGLKIKDIFIDIGVLSFENELLFSETAKVISKMKDFGVSGIIGKSKEYDEKKLEAEKIGCNYIVVC